MHCHPIASSYSTALLDEFLETVRPQTTVLRIGKGDRIDEHVLQTASELTFVYPTWWGTVPAALLRELVEVLGPWVDGPLQREPSPIAQVRTLRAVTTHGSSKLMNMVQGEPGLRMWRAIVLPLCAPGANFEWRALYGMDRDDAAARGDFLASLARPTTSGKPSRLIRGANRMLATGRTSAGRTGDN